MLTDQTIIAIRKGTAASTTEPFADSLAFARAVVEADRLQRMQDIAEIRRVLACVKSSVDSGIPVTDGWRILDALLASTPQQERKPMTEQERQELYVSLLNESTSGPGGMFKIIVEAVERHHGIRE